MATDWILMGSDLGGSMATADYYREQADTCLHMSHICADPILAERLGSLAAEFSRAAAEVNDYPALSDADRRERKRA